MEKLSLLRYPEYAVAMTRRKYRLLARGDEQTVQAARKFARKAIMLVAEAGTVTLIPFLYDYVAHANGEKGLTQGGTYAVVPYGDCATVGFVASHAVSPGEDVNVYISANGQPDTAFALSGSPIKVGVATVCFDHGAADASISILGINGGIEGKEEVIYTHPSAQASE